MTDWERARLGDLVETQKGYAFKSGWYCGAGRPIVKVSDFTYDSVDSSSLVCIPESTAIDYLKYELRTGDVVVQTVGSWPTNPASVVGKCVRIPVEVAGALLNQNAVKLTPADSFDRTFLFYLLRNEDFKTYIIGTAQGAASQAAITLEAIRNYEFELPSLAAQRRIAGILSAYDELIENSQRRIRILETMARTLYREWFVYFRFPGHEGSRRVSSPLGDIPEGWDVKPFGELATITMGLSPKGDTYNESGNGTPLVNGPVEFGDRFTKQVKWTTSPTKLCKKGDLVVCVRGSTTGRYVKSDDTYCLGRGVCGISSEFQTFVDLLFENELPTLLAQTSGSTFPSWTGPQLKSHPLLSPPSGLLSKFDLLVKPMSEAVLKYSHQIQNLRRTRDLLLPRLLSGQVNLEAYAA